MSTNPGDAVGSPSSRRHRGQRWWSDTCPASSVAAWTSTSCSYRTLHAVAYRPFHAARRSPVQWLRDHLLRHGPLPSRPALATP